MRYTGVWRETAIRRLARIWTDAADRNAVTQASDWVDAELADDAESKGSDYFGDRVLLAEPLWALYAVRPDDRLVEVLRVGRPGIDFPHDE